MRLTYRLLGFLPLAALALLTSCSTMQPTTQKYHVTALKPHNPAKVRVALSLSTQNVYVMEGEDRLLMAVQGNVGKNDSTPKGSFRIQEKIKNKRRVSEPDAGYPMAYWCQFLPAYGFHEGFVHPVPHTHGCIRLNRQAAARLFALVKVGTPVSIARTQPEDLKFSRQVMRLDESKDPDPPRSFMMSSAWFKDPPGPLLTDG